jgi:hypothetical protein
VIYAQIKQGQDISHLNKDGITFKDGSKLSADVIVLAYGLTGSCSSVILTHAAVQEMNRSWRLLELFLATKLPNNFRPRCGALTQRENLIKYIGPLDIRDFGSLSVDLHSPGSSVNIWWAPFLCLSIYLLMNAITQGLQILARELGIA